MITRLKNSPSLVFWILGGYFLTQLCVRLLIPHSLELDESAQVFYAQWPAFGYDTQPPFYNWVQTALFQALGTHLFALAFLKNVILFLTYLFLGLAAMRMVRSKELAVVAVLGLLTFPQLVFESQRDLTHSVAAVFASALFIYALIRTLDTPSWYSYALLGFATGIGLISKYNFALLPAAAFLAVVIDPEFRKRLFDLRILVAAIVGLLVILPHALWLLDHLDLATQGTINKLEGQDVTSKWAQVALGTISLAGALIGFAGLTFLTFLLLYPRSLSQTIRRNNRWSLLLGRIMLCALALLLVLILVSDSTNIKDRWLSPIFLILPLYLATKLDQLDIEIEPYLSRMWSLAKVILICMPLVMLVRIPAHGWFGDYTKLNTDYGAALSEILQRVEEQPMTILASDVHLAGNLRILRPDLPVLIAGYSQLIGDTRISTSTPLLVVWRVGKTEDMPGSLGKWIERIGVPRPYTSGKVSVPYNFGRPGDASTFGYALVRIDPATD